MPLACEALTPEEVLVVANRNAAGSMGLANYYMEKRNIPGKNLVALWVTDKETCSYDTYLTKIVQPVRRYLAENENGSAIRCLVLIYGVPLKVSGPEMTEKEKRLVERLNADRAALAKELAGPSDPKDRKTPENRLKKKRMADLDDRLRRIGFEQNKSASVDSEIALARAKDYPLSGWLPNPFYLGRPGRTLPVEKEKVLMVSRLDGPSADIVRRLIDDSLAAEAAGLTGTCYLDARWPDPGPDKKPTGYGFYDRSLHAAGEIITRSNRLPVVVDATEKLFQPGQCPEAALYCGWYSLARYVDAFAWQRGAVGYHIASSECATLKAGESQVWCKRMLEKGVAATIGPVGEPYVQAFPVPALFFGHLIEGYLTLAECYFLSLPYLSWKMVLVGDPLYRPFMAGKL